MRKRKKYIEACIIGIIIVFLVGTVSASVTEEDTWWEDFLKNLFTALGQQVGCETYPDYTGVFNSPKTVSCTGGEFPGTTNCLINVFHANYQGTQPAFECGNFDLEGEVNNCLEYIVTTGSRTIYPLGSNSIYEVYNCPEGSLLDGDNQIGDCDCDYGATASSCDSLNTCGVNKPKCMEQSGDDVCVTTGQYANKCLDGLDGSSTECDCDSNYFDSTWKNQRCPSIKPYCVDNSIMGTSYDACSTSPSGPGLQTCSQQGGNICAPGQTCSIGFAEVSDTNYCCLGTCEDIPTNGEVPSEDPPINVVIYDIAYPSSVKAGEFVKVEFKVKNSGPTRDYLIEVGIIPKQTADAWEFTYGIFDWFNVQWNTECCEGQPNIFAKTTELKNNEIDSFIIKIPQAPYPEIKDLCYDNIYWDGEGDYVLYVVVKNKCYKDGGRENVYETKIINLESVAVNGNGVEGIGEAKTITWNEYYSIEDKKILGSVCTSSLGCSPKKGYNVSCDKSEEIQERIFDANVQVCEDKTPGGLIGAIPNLVRKILIGESYCEFYQGISAWFKDIFGVKKPGVCIAESTTWYGNLWDGALKMVGGMGLPARYVSIITIMISITLIGIITKFVMPK